MLRSAPTFLKLGQRAASISRSAVVSSQASCSRSAPRSSLLETSRASSTGGGGPSSSSDYEQIMRPPFSSGGSPAAGGSAASYSTSYSTSSPWDASAPSPAAQDMSKSNCYQTVAEPSLDEDYDRYELHHPLFARTQVTYEPRSF
ncbi:hypothetical protein ACHAWF_006061 [Thalassiosira exigua]